MAANAGTAGQYTEGLFILSLGNMAALEQLPLAGQLLAQIEASQLELSHALIIQIISQDQLLPFHRDNQLRRKTARNVVLVLKVQQPRSVVNRKSLR